MKYSGTFFIDNGIEFEEIFTKEFNLTLSLNQGWASRNLMKPIWESQKQHCEYYQCKSIFHLLYDSLSVFTTAPSAEKQ